MHTPEEEVDPVEELDWNFVVEFVEDSDEAYCEGDPTLEDIDWDEVTRVQELFNRVNQHDEDDEETRVLEAFFALSEIYGDDLVIPGVTEGEY